MSYLQETKEGPEWLGLGNQAALNHPVVVKLAKGISLSCFTMISTLYCSQWGSVEEAGEGGFWGGWLIRSFGWRLRGKVDGLGTMDKIIFYPNMVMYWESWEEVVPKTIMSNMSPLRALSNYLSITCLREVQYSMHETIQLRLWSVRNGLNQGGSKADCEYVYRTCYWIELDKVLNLK